MDSVAVVGITNFPNESNIRPKKVKVVKGYIVLCVCMNECDGVQRQGDWEKVLGETL